MKSKIGDIFKEIILVEIGVAKHGVEGRTSLLDGLTIQLLQLLHELQQASRSSIR